MTWLLTKLSHYTTGTIPVPWHACNKYVTFFLLTPLTRFSSRNVGNDSLTAFYRVLITVLSEPVLRYLRALLYIRIISRKSLLSVSKEDRMC